MIDIHRLFFLFSSKLYLKNPDKEDLGTYSVSVSDTDGVSSSFVLDPEGNVYMAEPCLFWFYHTFKDWRQHRKGLLA